MCSPESLRTSYRSQGRPAVRPRILEEISLPPGLRPPPDILRRARVRVSPRPQQPSVPGPSVFASTAVLFRGGTRPSFVFLPASHLAVATAVAAAAANGYGGSAAEGAAQGQHSPFFLPVLFFRPYQSLPRQKKR